MREARIIIPQSAKAAARHIEARLMAAYEGWTRSKGRGAWYSPDRGAHSELIERVYIYDVAVNSCSATVCERLWSIAAKAAEYGNQTCVYLRLPTGSVHLVEPESEFDIDLELFGEPK